MGRGGAGRGGSKKFKLIQKRSYPIPTPPPLQGGENPHRAKWEGAGKNCHPYSNP